MDYETREQFYRDHEDNADERGYHVDGCFYCGADHPSDCCRDDGRDGYWA